MIVDASALIAILAGEPDARAFAEAIAGAEICRMSAAGYLETAIVVDARKDAVASAQLDELLAVLAIAVEPVSVAQARIARQAYRDYGKGSGHPAQLNFGDCFAYALAKDKGEPLLFKGADFARTDLGAAI
jgi:ribonuclease VapC